jgi:outer membrane protein assembly factor BamB
MTQGDVVVLDEKGKAIWTAMCGEEVTALTFFEGGLIVGTRSGQVCRFDGGGARRWLHRCQFRSERAFWPWWFLETPIIAALAAGHDPTSPQNLVAVGTGSTNLIFLEAETGLLIEDVVSRYGLPDRIRAHLSGSSGKLQFLVGHSQFTCGSTVRVWDPPPKAQERIRYEKSVDPMGRSMDGWDTCGVVDFWVGQLAQGTPDHMIVLRHGAVNQITVYEASTGEPLWDATLGGDPVALVVVPGESEAEARCYVAEQFGWLVGFDGVGRTVVATHLARSLQDMHAGPTGDLALWSSDKLYITRGDRPAERFCLEGNPLGWYRHPKRPGLLCVQKDQLHLCEVK